MCQTLTPQKSPSFRALMLPENHSTSSFFRPFYRPEMGPREANDLLLLLRCFEGSASCKSYLLLILDVLVMCLLEFTVQKRGRKEASFNV